MTGINTYKKTWRGATAGNVILAANVYQQDELRGVKRVIRSFAALTKSPAASQVWFFVPQVSAPRLFSARDLRLFCSGRIWAGCNKTYKFVATNSRRMRTYTKTPRGSSRESHGHQELSRAKEDSRRNLFLVSLGRQREDCIREGNVVAFKAIRTHRGEEAKTWREGKSEPLGGESSLRVVSQKIIHSVSV